MTEFDVDVLVMPKPGVNDPEGEAIHGGLRSLGHAAVARVTSGSYFRLHLTADSPEEAKREASVMADKLLANPVIQTFEVVSVTPSRQFVETIRS